MIFNISIELPDNFGFEVLRHIATKKNIDLSPTPTQEEVNAVSQAIAFDIIDRAKIEISQKAAQEAQEQKEAELGI